MASLIYGDELYLKGQESEKVRCSSQESEDWAQLQRTNVGGLPPKVTLLFPGFPLPLSEIRDSVSKMLPLQSQSCPSPGTWNSCPAQTGHSHTAAPCSDWPLPHSCLC